MATTKSTELSATEIELKRRGRRRLIGAVTIGLLGIVFLPMIFDGEPKRPAVGPYSKKQEISVQVPAKEGLSPLPAPAAAPAVTSSTAAQVPVGAPKGTSGDVAKPLAETGVVTLPPAGQSKSAPPIKSPDAPADIGKKGFAVQLGVFADADNAKQTIAKMQETKLPVYSDNVPIKNGTATRVRIGPFSTREQADSALVQIKLAGSDGKIVALQ